jgi:hypothetical protein
MNYTATAQHNGLSFTAKGQTDHEAITAAMQALKSAWSIDSDRAFIMVKLGGVFQYVTTAAKYQADIS